jgi:hypothetical protein
MRFLIGRLYYEAFADETHEKEKAPEGAFSIVAEWTGLEPATLGVTGRYSNRLNYRTRVFYSRPDSLKNQAF